MRACDNQIREGETPYFFSSYSFTRSSRNSTVQFNVCVLFMSLSNSWVFSLNWSPIPAFSWGRRSRKSGTLSSDGENDVVRAPSSRALSRLDHSPLANVLPANLLRVCALGGLIGLRLFLLLLGLSVAH